MTTKQIDGTDPNDPTQAEIVALIDGADITPDHILATRIDTKGQVVALTDNTIEPILNAGSEARLGIELSSPALRLSVDTSGNGIVDKAYALLASEVDQSFQLFDRLEFKPIWKYDPATEVTEFDFSIRASGATFTISAHAVERFTVGGSTGAPNTFIRDLGTAANQGLLITATEPLFGGVRFGPTDQGIYPELDDRKFLGGASFRWKAVYAVNGTIQTSAEKEKKDIQNIDKAAARSFVSALKPKKYKYKEDKDTDPDRYGFIAEEVEQLCEEQGFSFRGLHEDEDGNLGICYSDFVPLLIEQVQELRAEIDSLKKK